MNAERFPTIWEQLSEAAEADKVAGEFLVSVVLDEATDPDQDLGRYKALYAKRLEEALNKEATST